MTPTQTLVNALATLLADDTGTLAAATALKVHLIKDPFTPTPLTDLASLTEADFDGYATLSGATGNQQLYNDPVTGEKVIQMKEPAGGWHWQTTGVTNLPQTIYGFVLTDNTSAVTYGSQLLDTPVTLAASGDGLNVAQVNFLMALQPLS